MKDSTPRTGPPVDREGRRKRRTDHNGDGAPIRSTGGRGSEPGQRYVFGVRWRVLDLIHDGATFLRRRGLEHDRVGGVLVHRIDGPDPGLDLHDHPWEFVSIVLRGGYTEEHATIIARDPGDWLYCPGCGCAVCSHDEVCRWHPDCRGDGLGPHRARAWRRWSVHRMPLDVAHRITHAEPGTVTLVLRRPKVREWGFYLAGGWVLWKDYDYETRRPSAARSNRPGESHDQP